ncbi:MAG: cation:proton antiporter [Planctomycetaceae bacterium]
MHDLPLITTIAAGFTAAWVLGLLTQRLGLSPIVGYLLGGVIIGPYTPGYVGDVQIAQQLAEIGVILLMFGVGLHFHLKDLLAVKWVAIPGAFGQSLVATGLAIAVFSCFGLPVTSGAVIGMAMAVASTVVLMRVLIDADALNSPQGHIAVGWLLVEDIMTVVVLVLLPVLGGGPKAMGAGLAEMSLWTSVGAALLKLCVLVAILLFAGSRVVPWVLVQVARLRSRELFTLTILVFSIAIAAGSYVFFGASMALGAFLAGMMVALSPVSHQVASDALPMRDAFAVLFFVSVGMLFDPAFVLQQPLMLIAALSIILIAKPLAALVIVAMLGHSSRTALTVALGLAQIGEFSFIMSDLARRQGLMPDTGHHLLVASAILSIALNPLLFRRIPDVESWLARHPRLWSVFNARAQRRALRITANAEVEIGRRLDSGEQLAVVVGFGPVGRSVHRLLREASVTTVVVDLNMDTISELRAQGQPAVFGDASQQTILEQAGVGRANSLILTLPQSPDRLAVVAAARTLNPQLRILVRARYLREREHLEQAGATAAVFEEAEVAVALARLVLADTGTNRETVEHSIRDLRIGLILDTASNLRNQSVRTIMVPWPRVKRLSNAAGRSEVQKQIAKHRFSRWPVIDQMTGRPIGYLLSRDLLSQETTEADWSELIRPVPCVQRNDNVETALVQFQREQTTLCVVLHADSPVGLLTVEDILEKAVDRFQQEYVRDHTPLLLNAARAGAVVLGLHAATGSEAIAELASAVPAEGLLRGADVAQLVLAGASDVSFDLGCGVAIPHARCPGLRTPIVVIGTSQPGIAFSPESGAVIRLVFLLVTPCDDPAVHLLLLGQLAELAGNATIRARLLAASSPSEVFDILREADPDVAQTAASRR